MTVSITYPVIIDDKSHQCVIIGPMGEISSGITNMGFEYFYYIVNSNYCIITNEVYIGTNINNSLQTTNIYIVGGNSDISNRVFISLLSLTNLSGNTNTNTNTTADMTNWYLNAYWLGSGDTNTNLTYLDHYLCVYNFNTNGTYDYWEMTNTDFTYSYTNYSYSLNGNEISNLFINILNGYTFNGCNFGFSNINASNSINWSDGYFTYAVSYISYCFTNQIVITNITFNLSNYIVTNIVSNNITNLGSTNYTGSFNTNQSMYFELKPITNLNLPK